MKRVSSLITSLVFGPALSLSAGDPFVYAQAQKQASQTPVQQPAGGTQPGLPVLAKGEGVIFTAEPGGQVPLTGKDDKIVCQLRDGQRVKFLKETAGVGEGDSTASIAACGTRGTVPNARVLAA